MAEKLDAIALLKADHRKVEALFEKFEKAKSDPAKKSLVQESAPSSALTPRLRKRFSIPPAPARSRKIWSRKPMSSMTAPK
jgi:hypothetical protein